MSLKENPKSNYIGLFFPNAYLHMLHENDEYTFEFEGIEEEQDFLTVIARGLHQTNRFGGQSAATYTVLRHSLCIGTVLDETGAEVSEIFQGLMHDAGEAFVPDIPSPFKTEEDERRELAVLRAMPWELLHEPFVNPVKRWDTLACCTEARVYGHPSWDWPQKLEHDLKATQEEMAIYDDIFIKVDKIPDYMMEEIWIGSVNNVINSL